ncbi:hypothetical protein VNI00_012758 [Paramarasmius palmivorus]|uniref:Uncharacterized protein n=1 Tax=Paramarasmius palmivorus TaxID=297713 RepID=A0AAW0C5D6_9AGAR
MTPSASVAITLLGSLANLACTLQLLAAWNLLKEPESSESEWESSWLSRKWPWHPDGIQLIWGLLLAYCSTATVVCTVGFLGVVKRKSSLLKFYRDLSIADLSTSAFLALVGVYFAWQPTTSGIVCEGLARQPELMRDLAEIGLSSENCERWSHRAIIALLVVMILSIVAKLHFVLAVEIYYSHLARLDKPSEEDEHDYAELQNRSPGQTPLRRIYLARQPRPGYDIEANTSEDEEMVVYTRVPAERLPWRTAEDARREATARWVTGMASQPPRNLSPPSSPSLGSDNSSSYGMTGAGHVRLPILPGEGLFPPS